MAPRRQADAPCQSRLGLFPEAFLVDIAQQHSVLEARPQGWEDGRKRPTPALWWNR